MNRVIEAIKLCYPGGRARAVISPLAASLRSLVVDGIDLIEVPDPALSSRSQGVPFAAGIVLAPWPNRVEGARWWLDGVEQRLEVTEPEFGHANHGLLAGAIYRVVGSTSSTVTLGADISGAPGYPFSLNTQVSYRLKSTGMAVSHTVENHGTTAAPVAIGTHPYVKLGGVPTGDLSIVLGATRAFSLDERHIPRGSFSVDDTIFDLRDGVRVDHAVRHATFTNLPVVNGVICHRLCAPDGRSVHLWSDPQFAYVQIYITDQFPTANGTRLAIAIEPMTAPPNALRSGEGLRWLAPGESWMVEWGLDLVDNRAPFTP